MRFLHWNSPSQIGRSTGKLEDGNNLLQIFKKILNKFKEHKEEQYLELTKAVDFWMREVLAKNAHPCSMDKNCGKKLVDLLYEKFEYMPIVVSLFFNKFLY